MIVFLLFILALAIVFGFLAHRAYLRDRRQKKHLSGKVIFSPKAGDA
ncbi:MAG TPA: hypothetical protein VIV61_13750 [Candidatus Ozemobacteraceae bacterium]